MTATLEITPDDALRSIKRKGTDILAGVEIHPAATLFPMLDDRAFAELKADIDKHGQREMIVYWRGQLLDGRNRLRACRELKIQPSECELDEGDDPIAFVLSANLHRRHLTTAQRAMVAVELKKLLEPEAKERKTANLKKGKEKPEVENLPPRGKTRDKAGELLKVSGRTVDKAEKVLASGSPELIEEVKAGKVSIDKAAHVVEKTRDGKVRKRAAGKKAVALALHDERIQYWSIIEDLKDDHQLLSDEVVGFWVGAEKVLKDAAATTKQLTKIAEAAQLRTVFLAHARIEMEALETGHKFELSEAVDILRNAIRRASGRWPDDSQATLIHIWKQVADEWAIEQGIDSEAGGDD